MRIRLTDLISKRVIFFGLTILISVITVVSQQVPGTGETDVPTTFDKEFLTPKVPDKQKKRIKELMRHEAEALVKLGYDVATDRNGEVVVVTIPASRLFAPNETELSSSANTVLHNFMAYLRHPGKYKMLLKMHSDNTGSEQYNFDISEARVKAVHEYFNSKNSGNALLYEFYAGASEPLVAENSRINREKNRRLEIFLLPGPDMVQSQKQKSKK